MICCMELTAFKPQPPSSFPRHTLTSKRNKPTHANARGFGFGSLPLVSSICGHSRDRLIFVSQFHNNNEKRGLLQCGLSEVSSTFNGSEVSVNDFVVVNFYRFVFIKDPNKEVTKHLAFLQVNITVLFILLVSICRCIQFCYSLLYVNFEEVSSLFKCAYLQSRL